MKRNKNVLLLYGGLGIIFVVFAYFSMPTLLGTQHKFGYYTSGSEESQRHNDNHSQSSPSEEIPQKSGAIVMPDSHTPTTESVISGGKRISIQAKSTFDVLVVPDSASLAKLKYTQESAVAKPVRFACSDSQIYFLSGGKLYLTALNFSGKNPAELISENQIPINGAMTTGETIREPMDLALVEGKYKLLDKSNDIYTFDPVNRQWGFALKAKPTTQQPDPHYVAIDSWNDKTYLLDYARNQIVRLDQDRISNYFPREVMSWLIKPGDQNVVNGIDLYVDGNVYVLSRNGQISVYSGGKVRKQPWVELEKQLSEYASFSWRSITGNEKSLYIVEAQNNMLIEIDKKSGSISKRWILAGDNQDWNALHDFQICGGKKVALTGNTLTVLPEKSDISVAFKTELSPSVPKSLQGFIQPIPRAELPDNAGVYPGARRLYRYGIHEGADFFDPQNPEQGGKAVYYGAPVQSVRAGKVVRADRSFKEMTNTERLSYIAKSEKTHQTPRDAEDRFRGRQVWIRHVDGVTAIYAHLSGMPENIRVGQQVRQAETIGQVGNSGTSNGVNQNKENPHLHLEIWLSKPDDPVNGEYLGKWLSLNETRDLWEEVFK